MASKLAGRHPSEDSRQELDLILNGDHENCFHAQDHFTVDNSIGHVFDVISGNGIMRSDVGGDELVEIVKVSYLVYRPLACLRLARVFFLF